MPKSSQTQSQDQHILGPIETFAESLASVSFGDQYTDQISGLSGVCTGRFISMSEPEQIQLENENGRHWVPANRLTDSSGAPVLSSAVTEVAAS